jgi:F0F1-type ATP synthase assembly protein I
MVLLISKLKNINPLLAWSSDKELKKVIELLESSGFFWQDSKRSFLHKDINLTVSAKELSKFIGDVSLLEDLIKAAGEKKKETRDEKIGNIRVAGKVINVLVFLIIINFFLGWLALHLFFWALLEILLIALLVAFVKVRKKIKNTVTTKKYAC